MVLAGALVAPPFGAARPAATTKVTVVMVDYRFRLSVKTVRVGTVVFTVINRGELPHNFKIRRLNAMTPLLQAGQRVTLRVRITKPARYYYVCTVGNHELYGMAGYLRVVR